MRNKFKFVKSHGQALVEFALTLPLLLLLVFTFLDLGRAVYYYSAIGNAAREGARYASVTQGVKVAGSSAQDEVKNVVQNYSVALAIDPSRITFPTPEDPNPSDGVDFDASKYFTVQVEYDFKPITPFLPKIIEFLGGQIRLKTTSTMLLTPYARIGS